MKQDAVITETKRVSMIADGVEIEYVRVTASYQKLFKATWYVDMDAAPRVGDRATIEIKPA